MTTIEPHIVLQDAADGGDAPSRREYLPKGEALLIAFARVLRASVIYQHNNITFLRLVRECHQAMETITAAFGDVTLKVIRDACYLNNARVQVAPDAFSHYKGFIHEMRTLWLGELEFRQGVTEAHLVDFVFLLRKLEPQNESNYLLVKQELGQRGITTINVGKMDSFKDELHYVDSELLKRQSKEVYFTTLGVVKELMEDASHQKVLQVRKVKRLMLNAVNVIMRDESTLLSLANIKSYDDYTFTHSVNVAIYAIALGQRIGIPKKHLNYLGMAGLFHDIGKTDITKAILNKPAALTPAEWEIIQSHPIRGAEIVMKIRGWGELSTRMMTAAFEHHLRYDRSGYPQLSHAHQPSLFSRIITLVDCYDAIGRPRVYRRTPFLPDQIIEHLLQQSGKDFDPLLVKVFINLIGVYPLGSLVLLDTGEIGLVTQIQQEPELIDRPLVCLLRQVGAEYRKAETVDLAEPRDDQPDAYRRSIVKTLDPSDYHLNIEEYFI